MDDRGEAAADDGTRLTFVIAVVSKRVTLWALASKLSVLHVDRQGSSTLPRTMPTKTSSIERPVSRSTKLPEPPIWRHQELSERGAGSLTLGCLSALSPPLRVRQIRGGLRVQLAVSGGLQGGSRSSCFFLVDRSVGSVRTGCHWLLSPAWHADELIHVVTRRNLI